MDKQYQKSLLSAYGSSLGILTENEKIKFSEINVYTGASIDFLPGSSEIVLRKPGVYKITFDALFAPEEEAPTESTEIKIRKNDEDVKGAKTGFASVGVGSFRPASVTTLIRVRPSCCSIDNTAYVSVVNTGVSTEYDNVNITVTKLC